MNTAEKLNVIAEAGSTYHIRKYSGEWVPVVTVGNRVFTGVQCSTSGGAMSYAINLCATRSAALLEVTQ